jgi:hypothetical protein
MVVVQSFPEACLPAQSRVERLFTEGPLIEVPQADTMQLATGIKDAGNKRCKLNGF